MFFNKFPIYDFLSIISHHYFTSNIVPQNQVSVRGKDNLNISFVEFAKIAASSEIETIVERSLVGLPFEPYEMPIQGMPQSEENSYYELLTNDVQWEHIQQMQNITIVFNEVQEDVSIELVIVKN